MQCKGHNGKVRCIDWWDDDMGFTSTAQDGSCYFFDLLKHKEEGSRDLEYDFQKKSVKFTGMCNIPKLKYNAIVVGNDRKIWLANAANNPEPAITRAQIS